jgi:stearoyl-CoA desaturase (delta-9 desaturase)
MAIHVLAAAGLMMFPLPGWPLFLTTLALTGLGGLGTTLAYHRSLSHRAFKLNPAIEQFLIFSAVFNGSGVPTSWVANHRYHHAHADTIDDISSPRFGGFWWAHLRCLYQLPPSDPGKWCPDLTHSRYSVWKRLQPPIVLLAATGGFFVFGWAGLFWIGAIRLTYSLHLQAAVNSLLHLKKGVPIGEDSARNIGWLGPLQLTAWGENWHENHHSKPSSARFGRRWWQVDIGWYTICILKALRLATEVRS